MPSLRTAANGMSAQQSFMEAIADNIANASTTRTAEGGAYKRQVTMAVRDPRTGLLTTKVVGDPQKGRLVYEPGHPDANADGFVEYPNVDITTELVDLMVVRRVHEANATVFHAAKAMLRRALDI